MENNQNNFKTKLLNQAKTATGGLVYSATICGMAVISLLFSIAITSVAASLETTIDVLSEKNWYKYASYILYQIVFVGIIVVFSLIYKQKPSKYGYRKTSPKYFIIALALAFGLLFGLNNLNNFFAETLQKIGATLPETSLPTLTSGGIAGVLLVVAVLPAFCEETLFRGIILDCVKDIGTVAACLLGGLLFSIFHQNPLQTIYQFICGACFTLLAIRADSVFPTIVIHFINNAVIIFNERFGFLNAMSATAEIIICVVAAVLLVLSVGYLVFFDKKTNLKKQTPIKPFILYALAGIILSFVLWIASFATYFA